MTTDDIDQAFRIPNIKPLPLYSHSPHNLTTSHIQAFNTVPSKLDNGDTVLHGGRGNRFRSRFMRREDNVTQAHLMDSPLASHGGCPTADFRNPASHHQRHGRIFDFEVNCWSTLDVCPHNPVHHERSPANPTTHKTGSIEGVATLLRQAHIIIVASRSRRLYQEDGSACSLRHNAGLQALLPYPM